MTPSQKVEIIIKRLSKLYPNPKTPLYHRNVFELFVAVLLSAQMQDARLNKILPGLFKKYKSARDFADASIEELQEDLKSVNYYKTKARHLKEASARIVQDFGGKVPNNLKDLTSLPGVGKKTANVILNEGFGNISGIVVDTHVKRLAQRLGLSKHSDPKKIEEDLKKIVPKEHWLDFSLYLIFYGREICTAKNPKCDKCVLRDVCEYGGSKLLKSGGALRGYKPVKKVDPIKVRRGINYARGHNYVIVSTWG